MHINLLLYTCLAHSWMSMAPWWLWTDCPGMRPICNVSRDEAIHLVPNTAAYYIYYVVFPHSLYLHQVYLSKRAVYLWHKLRGHLTIFYLFAEIYCCRTVPLSQSSTVYRSLADETELVMTVEVVPVTSSNKACAVLSFMSMAPVIRLAKPPFPTHTHAHTNVAHVLRLRPHQKIMRTQTCRYTYINVGSEPSTQRQTFSFCRSDNPNQK